MLVVSFMVILEREQTEETDSAISSREKPVPRSMQLPKTDAATLDTRYNMKSAANFPRILKVMLRQSGVIPYRIHNGRVEVLLITVSKQKRWGIPKGWIEPRMSAIDSAAKEAYEEAGILGTVHSPALGHYRRRKWGMSLQVEVFLMRVEQVLDDWAEVDERKRCWLSVSQAQKQVKKSDLKNLLAHLQELPLEVLTH